MSEPKLDVYYKCPVCGTLMRLHRLDMPVLLQEVLCLIFGIVIGASMLVLW